MTWPELGALIACLVFILGMWSTHSNQQLHLARLRALSREEHTITAVNDGLDAWTITCTCGQKFSADYISKALEEWHNHRRMAPAEVTR